MLEVSNYTKSIITVLALGVEANQFIQGHLDDILIFYLSRIDSPAYKTEKKCRIADEIFTKHAQELLQQKRTARE
jgi:hypothetical protein